MQADGSIVCILVAASRLSAKRCRPAGSFVGKTLCLKAFKTSDCGVGHFFGGLAMAGIMLR